jgi:hypothetical protein
LNYIFNKFGFRTIECFSNQDEGRAYNYHVFIRSDQRDNVSNSLDSSETFNLRIDLQMYCEILEVCNRRIESITAPIWGVCASELTPTLAYFMKSDLDFCRGVFDTSSHKVGKHMVNVKPRILSMDHISMSDANDYFFVTAPNIAYPVLTNLRSHGAQNFIIPTFVF